MGKAESCKVTMRVRVGDSEVEITGPAAFVEKKVEEFLASHKASPSMLRNSPAEAKTAITPAPTVAGKKMAVAQFFKKVAVRSDVDRVLAAGYYLENNENLGTFTTADIVETIRKAKSNPPKNTSDAVGQNIRKGLMMPSGDKDGNRAYVLTSDGEEIIQQRLVS